MNLPVDAAWASVRRVVAAGEPSGFRVNFIDLRDINNTVMVDLDGHGELIEVHFRSNPTGYLAYHHTFIHGTASRGDRWSSWAQTAQYIASFSKRED